MRQKQSIWSFIAAIIPITSLFIFISPYLLFTYLNILNAENFFPFLLSETYLFPYLLFISFFWFLVFMAIYISPSLIYRLLQFEANKKNTKNIYYINRVNFLTAFLLAPIITYSLISVSVEHGLSGLLTLGSASILFTIFILTCDLKLTIKDLIKKDTFLLLVSTILFSFIVYYTTSEKTQLSIIPSLLAYVFLITLIYLRFKYYNQIIPNFNMDRIFMLFLTLMILIIVSLLMTLFISPNAIANQYKNPYFIDFIKLYLILFLLPNIIIYAISRENISVKLIFISGYLVLLFTFTNIVDYIAYKSFRTMQFINEEEISINVNKWHSPKRPIPIRNDEYNENVFNAFQSLNYSLLCKRKNEQFTISEIHLRSLNNTPIKNDDFFCIYIANKDIKVISPTKTGKN
ncbi:hypothetical protein ABN222_04260 [Providencia alcalifaciens]